MESENRLETAMDEQDWEGRTTGGGVKNETKRKFGKITFMQRDEDDPAEIEQVRMELVKELSRGKGRDSEDWDEGDELDLSEGILAEGGFGSEDWESFLPHRRLRVLLVEDDDSTRHVVGALLRNCNYEVTAASNGMQAWEFLEDGSREFDLVLTDVIMPGLSGIGLLSRVMARESHKTLPVIMMSSHDSMDLVLKCFQKGAADFLVKPVRKNELKNLWQHVWRNSRSSSGCGSGSGSQTDANIIANNCQEGSGHGSDDGGRESGRGSGNSLNTQAGGSDNGSGTQADASVMLARDKFKDRSKAKSDAANSLDHSLQGRRNETSTLRVHSNAEDKPSESPTPDIPSDDMKEEGEVEKDRMNEEERKMEMETDLYGTEVRREEISLGTSSTPKPNSTPEQEFSSPAVKTMDLLAGLCTHKPSAMDATIKLVDEHGRVSAEESMEINVDMKEDVRGKVEEEEEDEEEDEEDGGNKDMDRRGSNSPQGGDSDETAQEENVKDEEKVDVTMFDLTLKRQREVEETEEEKEEKRILTQSRSSAFSRYSTIAQGSLSNQQQSHKNSNISPSAYPSSLFPPSHASMASRLPVKHDHLNNQEGSSIAHPRPFHLSHQNSHTFNSQNTNQTNQNASDLNPAVSSNLPPGMFIGGMSHQFPLIPSLQPSAILSFDQIQNSYRSNSNFIHPAYFSPSSNHCWSNHGAEGDMRIFPDANCHLPSQQSSHAQQPHPWRTHHPHPSHPSLQSEGNGGKKMNHHSEYMDNVMESYGSLRGSNNAGNSSNVLSSVGNRNSNENDSNGNGSNGNGSNGNGSHGVVSIRKDHGNNGHDGDVNKNDENMTNAVNGSDGDNSNGNGSPGNGNGSIVDMPCAFASAATKKNEFHDDKHVVNGNSNVTIKCSNGLNAMNADGSVLNDGNVMENRKQSDGTEGNVTAGNNSFSANQTIFNNNNISHNAGNNVSNVNMNDDNGTAANWHSRREAALHKFRQKRKERCFEKKVRYQSRKKLAEQRPRVKGQFVKQDALNNQR